MKKDDREVCSAYIFGRDGPLLSAVESIWRRAPHSNKLRGPREGCYRPVVVDQRDENVSHDSPEKGLFSRSTVGS